MYSQSNANDGISYNVCMYCAIITAVFLLTTTSVIVANTFMQYNDLLGRAGVLLTAVSMNCSVLPNNFNGIYTTMYDVSYGLCNIKYANAAALSTLVSHFPDSADNCAARTFMTAFEYSPYLHILLYMLTVLILIYVVLSIVVACIDGVNDILSTICVVLRCVVLCMICTANVVILYNSYHCNGIPSYLCNIFVANCIYSIYACICVIIMNSILKRRA